MKRPFFSALAFFGTLWLASVVYSWYVGLSSVSSWDALTVSRWNQIKDNFDDLNTRISNVSWGSVPSGAVFYFAMNSCPDGYLKANGSLVSRTSNATLFSAIWTTFGAGDGSTTFALPDLRGEFIRGWSDGRTVDSGRAFGSVQADEFKSHTHDAMYRPSSSIISGANFQGGSWYGYQTPSLATGWAETRPRNVALLACIKK